MPEDNAETRFAARFSEKLKVLRQRKGLTLEAVAKGADVAPRAYSGWEAGKLPSGTSLVRLAEFYGITPAELLK